MLPNASPSDFDWQQLLEWGQTHYRSRIFQKDERIPTRPGLLYLVIEGTIRLSGKAQENQEAFLGFVTKGQPFEILAQTAFVFQAFAHVEPTSVMWMYWHDLEHWPQFYRRVMEVFRYQHQRKLIWLSILGQKRTIDRLLGFLSLLIEEYGEPTESGYCLPFPLTHAQIGNAIGSTRVTVTRLMGKLRQKGLITVQGDNLIYLRCNSPLKLDFLQSV